MPDLRQANNRRLKMSMTGWTLADCEKHKRRIAGATVAPVTSEAQTGNLVAVKTLDATRAKCNVNPKRKKTSGQPNKTEADYNFRYLGGRGMFEGVTFRLEGGSKYTPDWVYWNNGVMFAVECKGAYRFGSEGRALVAFLEARARFKNVVFLWFVKQENGEWIEKHVDERS